MGCSRVGEDHCCWLRGEPCRYVTDAGPGADPRWSCSLRVEHGGWAPVHADARYLVNVKPELEAMGITVDCGDWPPPGEVCGTCGATSVTL